MSDKYEIKQNDNPGKSWTIYRNGKRWGGCDFTSKELAESFLAANGKETGQ